MKPKKKDKNYIPILDQPIDELKKPMGKPVDFGKIMDDILPKKQKCLHMVFFNKPYNRFYHGIH